MNKLNGNLTHIDIESFLDIAGVMFVVLDVEGTVHLINKKGCDILECDEQEILGKNWFDHFLPPRFKKDVKKVFNRMIAGELKPAEYFINPVKTKNSEEKIIAWHNAILKDDIGRIIGTLSSGEDITQRQQAKRQIKKSLKEKEILIKEIHHRFKNNLHVISSLLSLQAAHIKTKQEAIEAFKRSRDRIYSMALVHKKLYGTRDLTNIDMQSYIDEISRQLLYAYAPAGNISMEIQTKEFFLDINHAIPCGLILNELVTNALKHAFPKERKGKITLISRKEKGDRCRLSVSDNGVRLPCRHQYAESCNTGAAACQLVDQADRRKAENPERKRHNLFHHFPLYKKMKRPKILHCRGRSHNRSRYKDQTSTVRICRGSYCRIRCRCL